jgi:hypothetical protein
VLVAAHLEVPAPTGVRVVPVSTALELEDAMVREAEGADVVIMAAAVADYRPVAVSAGKIKKEEAGDELSVALVRNPDILQRLAADAALPRADGTHRLVVGFSAVRSSRGRAATCSSSTGWGGPRGSPRRATRSRCSGGPEIHWPRPPAPRSRSPIEFST